MKKQTCDCERLNDAAIRDLTENATNRAHHAIGDACQLIDCSSQQHLLALSVICSLIVVASQMLKRPKSTRAKDVAFTLENVALMLKQYTGK
jgi:hypothetical protein